MAETELLVSSLAPGLRTSLFLCALLSGCILCLFLPVIYVASSFLIVLAIWSISRHTVSVLGFVLGLMPFHFLMVLLGQFFRVPHMTVLSAATKEIPLVIVGLILLFQNRIKLVTPDWLLIAAILLAALRTVFGGELSGLRDDFQFVLPYFVGRVTILGLQRERLWAQAAIWIAAILSLLGIAEMFLGPAPRELLYSVVATDLVSIQPGRALPNSFYATGFEGIRAAATTVGPPSLAAFCMVALVVWWIYSRRPVPGMIIFSGLLSTLTRSAWIGALCAISILAIRSGVARRLIGWAIGALVVFIITIPVLGLHDYLSFSRSGQDESEQVHRESISAGLDYALAHPFGAGAGNVGPIAAQKNAEALITENTYLAFAAEYGLITSGCLVAFLLLAGWTAWKQKTRIGDLALATIVGIGLMMLVLLVHEDVRLDCWVWFPIGVAIGEYTRMSDFGEVNFLSKAAV